MKNVFSDSFWGITSKVVAAVSQFFMIPLLIGVYGKDSYGLFALAFSLNAYLRLMELGLNNGSIRYFSIWFSQSDYAKIRDLSQSSIVFYLVIGLINSMVFVFLGFYAHNIFNLSEPDQLVFKWMMIIMGSTTIFNWLSFINIQLLTAYEGLGWISKVSVIKSIFNLGIAILSISLEWGIIPFFLLYSISNLIVIPLNLIHSLVIKLPIFNYMRPKWNWVAFKEVLNYSISIFFMGIFQLTALQLQPILLGAFSEENLSTVADYQVIRTITSFIVAIGAVFMQVLLPIASKCYASNNQEKLDIIVYNGTKYISLFLLFVIFNLVLSSGEILYLYLGKEYTELSIWLIFSFLTTLYLHISCIASLVLASGKTKPIMISSALGCVISLFCLYFLIPYYQVGAPIIGYAIYMVFQMVTYYFIYMPSVLKIDLKKLLLKKLLPSLLIALFCLMVSFQIKRWLSMDISYLSTFVNCSVFSVLFTILSGLFILKFDELRSLASLND